MVIVILFNLGHSMISYLQGAVEDDEVVLTSFYLEKTIQVSSAFPQRMVPQLSQLVTACTRIQERNSKFYFWQDKNSVVVRFLHSLLSHSMHEFKILITMIGKRGKQQSCECGVTLILILLRNSTLELLSSVSKVSSPNL